MVVKFKSIKRKIRKVTTRGNGALGAATDQASTLHTFTDPGTTKRIVGCVGIVEDAYVAGDYYRMGLCITRPGETLPDTANIAAEENRWLFYEEGIVSDGENFNPNRLLDMKIQRKVKDGDILSLVMHSLTVGDFAFGITVFIDET